MFDPSLTLSEQVVANKLPRMWDGKLRTEVLQKLDGAKRLCAHLRAQTGNELYDRLQQNDLV